MAGQNEVELKLYVRDLDAVRQRLESAGAVLVSPRTYERNVRYDDKSRSLSRRGDVLRLREDSRWRLTYKAGKGAVRGSDAVSRYEAEVEVSDFDTMHDILGRLGLSPYMVYEKYRTTYQLDGVEVVLDEMPYGNFVEIEGEAEAIQQVRLRLGLGEATAYRGGYTDLFERVRRKLKLKFTDLTFANFEQIDVPQSAFD
ncbi:MAG: class IV adenylate cyclase [Chloroflexota bacterium]|nr:MAG: hypothetical protein DIU68_03660 [Chloroflexota bacterium]